MSQTIFLPGHIIRYIVFKNLVFHTPVLAWIKNGIAQTGLRGAYRQLGFITLNSTIVWSLVGGWV